MASSLLPVKDAVDLIVKQDLLYITPRFRKRNVFDPILAIYQVVFGEPVMDITLPAVIIGQYQHSVTREFLCQICNVPGAHPYAGFRFKKQVRVEITFSQLDRKSVV